MFRSLIVVPFFGVLCACSAIEPAVGPAQDAAPSCGPATTAAASPYGGSSPAVGDGGACVAPDPRCQPDGGYEDGACDHCEDTYCCTTRFGCYDDPGCFIADQALDSCTASGPDAGSTSSCWDTFTSAGPIEKIRFACQRMYCQEACGIP